MSTIFGPSSDRFTTYKLYATFCFVDTHRCCTGLCSLNCRVPRALSRSYSTSFPPSPPFSLPSNVCPCAPVTKQGFIGGALVTLLIGPRLRM